MPFDDDRREKSKQHREAAYSRWENTTDHVKRKSREGVTDALIFVLGLPMTLFGFLARQTVGTWRRTRGFLGWITLDRLMPSGLAGAIQEVIDLLPKALGLRGTPRTKQFSAAVILGVLAYFATFLTGGLLIGAAVVLTLMVVVALGRNIPFVNRTWQDTTAKLPVKNDYDIIGWERD
ncbi:MULTISPECIES: hypothetical protein [Halorussus]|uniref:hypothetical protein n=1 Tax=Halorussus TaxID=1070314 RepID=UPI00209CE242|nr:hypothetical protein [Halorussus vallis]USZ78635.1 hypothetical protein NGM07_25130 [Halorussus vallis]USZ78666.1 hypothetical protein NGM07_24460 [Halorussus vallis]